MTQKEAREILMLYRPGTADADEPEVIEALAVARQDPELAGWFEEHVAFQKVMKLKFREINVPDHLKMALLVRQPILPPRIWAPGTVWLAAAAVVLLFLGVANFWLKPSVPDRFANFRERMVSTALREYRMDIVTNDMIALRHAIEATGAPADYELSPGLEKLRLTGGATLIWRNHPVSMVCFDRGNKSMVFLFVMKRTAVKDPPPLEPKVTPVSDLLTASWTRGDNSYLLLASSEPDFPRQYLQ